MLFLPAKQQGSPGCRWVSVGGPGPVSNSENHATIVMPESEYKDCVVIGGGPAGSAFAGIAAKHAPEASIVILEKERFPRYRIGESTIPVANTVLRELGVFDALYNGGAVKKVGISFVWGSDRVPWNADYLQIAGAEGALGAEHTIDVLGQDLSTFSARFAPSRLPFVAFNVERSRFDQLLLERAAELGVDCRQGVAVTEIVRERGVVCGVRYRDDRGAEGLIRTPFVLDGSGLSALLTRGKRVRDPDMNNFAVHGYFSGAKWKSTLSGTEQATTVFIASVPLGWLWYFPIRPDLMSVGFVTHKTHFRSQLGLGDPEALYRRALLSCPEISPLLAQAELRDDILPEQRRVQVCQDWSSWAESPVGPGWAAAGDAAMFVDPILSSGVTLALQSGHRAAYTWLTLRRRPELDPAPLWRAYADYLRGEAFSFLALARFFYANNRAAESWWWQAQRLLHARGRLDLEPRRAFTLATAGFFPVPRAIGLEIVAPLLEKLSGTQPNLMGVYEHPGLSRDEIDLDATVHPRVSFRLAVRSEPSGQGNGSLEIYHDLMTDDPALGHRLAALPSRISPELSPVVAWLQEPVVVGDLLNRAVRTLATAASRETEIRQVTLELVRRAVIKGFVRLERSPEAAPERPTVSAP
jgi:flavin-dependent dehydrogenase